MTLPARNARPPGETLDGATQMNKTENTVPEPESFVDIHCHLVPGIDDGARDWDECLAMARLAVAEGIGIAIATPHQCGSYARNDGDTIRRRVAEVQQFLDREGVPLQVLAGGDVRIEPGLAGRLRRGKVMSLADRRQHVLLELPHEIYFPLEPLLAELAGGRIVGILSHPERNAGIVADPEVVGSLVDAGCLMQITAGSLLGEFGTHAQRLSEHWIREGLVHFIATDAHDTQKRRARNARGFRSRRRLAGEEAARNVCSRWPAAVAEGREVPAGQWERLAGGWFGWRRTG